MTTGYAAVITENNEHFMLISVWLTDEGFSVSHTGSPKPGELCLYDADYMNENEFLHTDGAIYIADGAGADKIKNISPDAKILPRPFTRAELLEAVSEYAEPANDRFALDAGGQRLWYGKLSLALTDKECRMADALIKKRGTAVTREELYEIAGSDRTSSGDTKATNAPDVYICMLRRKISKAFGINPIVTVRGVGYMFAE